jgi:hypothetical protein
MTVDCLVFGRGAASWAVLGRSIDFDTLLRDERDWTFLGVLLRDISGILIFAETAPGAVTTEAPQWARGQRGRIPGKNNVLAKAATVALHSLRKASPFCDNLMGTSNNNAVACVEPLARTENRFRA